jgi:hypothetical protein
LSDLKQTVTIKLLETDLLELQRILLDEDTDAALEFLKIVIAQRLPKKDGWSCNSNNFNQYI